MTSVAKICSIEDCSKRKNELHGLSKTRLYYIWALIRKRTTNVNDPTYKDYGGRGIKMCKGWMDSFKSFNDMIGERPDKSHSIDRIDNDKGYTCGQCEECQDKGLSLNVRWATNIQQLHNRRIYKNNKSGYRGVHIEKNRYKATITIDGRRVYIGVYKTAIEAARAYNVAAIKSRGKDTLLNDI